MAGGEHSYWVASESAVPVRSAAIGAVKADEDQAQVFVPMGRRHAVLSESTLTACGRSLTGLNVFPEVAWAEFSLASRSCPACLAAIEDAEKT
jgi:hypothetical protein